MKISRKGELHRGYPTILINRYIFSEFRFISEIPPMKDLYSEFTWMKNRLEKLNNQIVFCHNDLLLANIIFDENKHSIQFIDMEYAAPNYQLYDIANHFCEFAG